MFGESQKKNENICPPFKTLASFLTISDPDPQKTPLRLVAYPPEALASQLVTLDGDPGR